jgi:hypothetical protein
MRRTSRPGQSGRTLNLGRYAIHNGCLDNRRNIVDVQNDNELHAETERGIGIGS